MVLIAWKWLIWFLWCLRPNCGLFVQIHRLPRKNSEIHPIPNVHAHTIGIVFASSKPIGIEYCFDDVWIKRLRLNGAQLNNWIYWWTIEFIRFNFSIGDRWRKGGCQRVYELGLEQLFTNNLQPLHIYRSPLFLALWTTNFQLQFNSLGLLPLKEICTSSHASRLYGLFTVTLLTRNNYPPPIHSHGWTSK